MRIFEKFIRRKKDYIDEIVSKLGCDCSIVEVKDIPGVMDSYHQALIQGKKEGYTPLIIIPSEMMLEIVDTDSDKEYPNDERESILKKAKSINAKKLLKRMLTDALSMEEGEEDDMIGEFIVDESTNHFLSVDDLEKKKIIFAKIPTDKPWEVAAWVPMGGFNDCPSPEEQVAVFKYWYEKYGAIPALVTSDVWELWIEHPPNTQEEAELLAREQFGFCGDIVWQGVGSVNGLAGSLIHSSVWYFWWD